MASPNQEKNQLRLSLAKMRDIYEEKRSDVADMCQAILDGKDPKAEYAEHRYVEWTYNGVDFMYDTLTTLVKVRDDEIGHWMIFDNIDYTD